MVVAYLLFNFAGRLSVALFGLTFDLNEVDGIEFPVMVADWGRVDWFENDTALPPEPYYALPFTSVGE
jgi:hypothetical protein